MKYEFFLEKYFARECINIRTVITTVNKRNNKLHYAKRTLIYQTFVVNAEKELTVAIRPVIVESMANLLVNGAHCFHVGFAPLPAQILGLHFQQLQDVELQQGMFHFQRTLQYGSRFKDDQHLTNTKQESIHYNHKQLKSIIIYSNDVIFH